MERTESEIEELIEKTKKELQSLEKERVELKTLTREQKLATELHKVLCWYDHTNGCGWEYETWDDPGYAKKLYLQKARDITKLITDKTNLFTPTKEIDELITRLAKLYRYN